MSVSKDHGKRDGGAEIARLDNGGMLTGVHYFNIKRINAAAAEPEYFLQTTSLFGVQTRRIIHQHWQRLGQRRRVGDFRLRRLCRQQLIGGRRRWRPRPIHDLTATSSLAVCWDRPGAVVELLALGRRWSHVGTGTIQRRCSAYEHTTSSAINSNAIGITLAACRHRGS